MNPAVVARMPPFLHVLRQLHKCIFKLDSSIKVSMVTHIEHKHAKIYDKNKNKVYCLLLISLTEIISKGQLWNFSCPIIGSWTRLKKKKNGMTL